MKIDLKYEPTQQVVVFLDGSYRFARITGYEVASANFTGHEQRIKYELSVPESILDKNGKEVPLDPRVTWAREEELTELLARLKSEREKSPDSKPSTLLWNMRADDNKRDS